MVWRANSTQRGHLGCHHPFASATSIGQGLDLASLTKACCFLTHLCPFWEDPSSLNPLQLAPHNLGKLAKWLPTSQRSLVKAARDASPVMSPKMLTYSTESQDIRNAAVGQGCLPDQMPLCTNAVPLWFGHQLLAGGLGSIAMWSSCGRRMPHAIEPVFGHRTPQPQTPRTRTASQSGDPASSTLGKEGSLASQG